MMPWSLALLVTLLAVAVFQWKRTHRYLRYLQLEDYDVARFGNWILRARAFDRKGTWPCALAALAAVSPSPLLAMTTTALSAGVLSWWSYAEEDPRVTGKVKLVLTPRATRLRSTALAIAYTLLAGIGCFIALAELGQATLLMGWILSLIAIQATPLYLVAAVALLAKDEARRQRVLLAEARMILTRVDPFVIGITGSYGKTTTKTFLGEMLAAQHPTFWPPKSINTPMGITRELRERLRPEHRYAVIEMGAYYRGSIRKLCILTPPRAAIVTSVGIMHLERFGSKEDVFLAKSELAQAVPPDGILVCNADDPGALRISRSNPKAQNLLYGIEPPGGVAIDCLATHIDVTPEGMRFRLAWQGRTHDCFAPVHGFTMVSNLLAAFTMAATLGVEPSLLVAVMRNIRPVDNRLQVVRDGSVTTVRDAYNSNPSGFRDAVTIVQALPATRRVLITPGMVELGERQVEENQAAAEYAARVFDIALVVGPTNRDAIVTGLLAGGMPPGAVREVESRDAALAAWQQLVQAGDTVLIENDLPDLYESQQTF